MGTSKAMHWDFLMVMHGKRLLETWQHGGEPRQKLAGTGR